MNPFDINPWAALVWFAAGLVIDRRWVRVLGLWLGLAARKAEALWWRSLLWLTRGWDR